MSGAGAPQHTACAVCGHVLNWQSSTFGEIWVHGLKEDSDHPAVPVPSGSIHTISLCDFCLTTDAGWALPVENYVIEREGLMVGENIGDWQSCTACAALLERGEWDSLTERAMIAARIQGEVDEGDRALFEDMYRQLREHIIGRVHLDR